MVVLGNFNTKSSNWYKHDKTAYEGSTIDAVTSQFGLQQLIKEQTHILGSSSLCIDLIFTSHPSLRSFSKYFETLDVLQYFPFTISETTCNYYLETWHIRVAKQLKS